MLTKGAARDRDELASLHAPLHPLDLDDQGGVDAASALTPVTRPLAETPALVQPTSDEGQRSPPHGDTPLEEGVPEFVRSRGKAVNLVGHSGEVSEFEQGDNPQPAAEQFELRVLCRDGEVDNAPRGSEPLLAVGRSGDGIAIAGQGVAEHFDGPVP